MKRYFKIFKTPYQFNQDYERLKSIPNQQEKLQ